MQLVLSPPVPRLRERAVDAEEAVAAEVVAAACFAGNGAGAGDPQTIPVSKPCPGRQRRSALRSS